MSVAENMAIARRVEKLEREILAVEPRRFRTTFRVFQRGAEPAANDAGHARQLAANDPVVEIVGEYPDLDVLIDARSGARIFRLDGDDAEFDELAAGVEVLEVAISCYQKQLAQIVSDAPITATRGGTRAGKTRVLVWWLFRQWLIRGHGADDDHEKEARFWWLRESVEMLYEHAIAWVVQLWPDVWVGKMPTPTTKSPKLTAFDGSVFSFRHAAHSGKRAGTNLRSESVAALVIDELSAILNQENWREAKSRVAQTAGPIAVAFTPTAGHWSAQLVQQAADSGGAIVVDHLLMFDNPWWPWARIFVDLLKDAAITATQLREKILPAEDWRAAVLEEVKDPAVRRMRFGEEQALGLTLWRLWDPARSIYRGPPPLESIDLDGQILPNTTGEVIGAHFGRREIVAAGGKDFNVSNGVCVVFRVFGDRQRPVVYVFDELADSGPTVTNAERIASKYPGLCIFCDPTGALDGRHPSHGASSTTDAEEMRLHGLDVEPANGWTRGRRVAQLPQLDSINAMHRAMRLGLLVVHPRCSGVMRALAEMKAKPDGTIEKVSGSTSISDRISDYGDALRYGVWPVWRHFLEAETKVHQ